MRGLDLTGVTNQETKKAASEFQKQFVRGAKENYQYPDTFREEMLKGKPSSPLAAQVYLQVRLDKRTERSDHKFEFEK